jgi:diguanylate cyclase (GGDEF)-like protein
MVETAQPIRVLLVEDVESDAALALHQLKHAGLQCVAHRVLTEIDLRAALRDFSPDVILSDFCLPQFDGLAALEVARECAPEVPFIFLSGTIGEERAVNALLRGAVDYVLKGNTKRLVPAVRRALSDAQLRRERRAEQARIARLDRVLRMLSGVNALMVRVRERRELLNETCRLAVTIGGYAAAIVYLRPPSASNTLQAQARGGVADQNMDVLQEVFLESERPDASLLEQVVRTRKEFICPDTTVLAPRERLKSAVEAAGLRSLVMLPLALETRAIGCLVLAATDATALSADELQMLREVAGNLSFVLQYLNKDTTVRFLSNYDPHTGLAKRSLFCEQLAQLIESRDARRTRYGVAIIDITGLNLINDSFSRRIGDLLLQQAAARLKRRFPQQDRIGHFGGGTFAIVVEARHRSLDETLATVREHENVLFREPFEVEGQLIPVGVKLGLAVHPDHGQDAASLVQSAETALRNAQTSGDCHYNQQQHAQLHERLALEHRLRLALQREQFELHYQPKVNVVSRRIEGVEALLRWRDPKTGLVQPADFLPVLESMGLIVEVGEWVIRQAGRDCQHWLNAGLAPVRVAVNVAPSQLRRSDFVEAFLKAQAGCSAGAGLDLEITEGTLQEELTSLVTKLKLLRQAGVRIAIDDFGTGYSSLSRLSKLPIDTLKIDRTFICGVPKDYGGRLIVKTIITLARAFRLSTVAEGVEAQDQLDFLWQAGCDQSQGFLHSRALPRDEFMELMIHGNGQFVLPPELSQLPESAAGTGKVARAPDR